MQKTIIVAGYGPGISAAVARKFGSEGYAVALVARSAERVEQGAAELVKQGIPAKGFAVDLGDGPAVQRLVRDVRAALGPIAILHWNAYAAKAGDLLRAPEELRTVLDVGVHGLLTALVEALPDLKEQKGSVLVTGGGLAYFDANVDSTAVQWGAMGLSVSKAAQHKLVGLLNKRLAAEGVYAGEVTVLGLVKGTPFDGGRATLEPSTVADAFWKLNQQRTEVWVSVP